MTRRALIALFAMAVAGGLTAPGSAQAQNSNLSVTYTSLKATPTADDFAQGFVVIGRFDVTITACRLSNCYVRTAATSQPTTDLRVQMSAAPTSQAQCVTTIPTASPTLFVGNATTFPTTFTVYVCYRLSWTGTSSAPSTFAPSQFVFRLIQSNSAGS